MRFVLPALRALPVAGALLLLSAAVQASPSGAVAAAAPDSLMFILAMALAGGLVLNLMPCVLPLLSLKVLSVLGTGAQPGQLRRHALAYTAGVLLSFLLIGGIILVLRSTGSVLGWGFQLQQPVFVAVLAWLMVLVGLSLAGMFTLGGSVGATGQKLLGKSGYAGDFWSGVLACVVASPCVAPFMGPALVFAFSASWATALLVFLMLGLGLALPFLLIGFFPALGRWLPRPGAWMETLKVLLAFPMLLTAVWLVWLLGNQKGMSAVAIILSAAVVLGMGLWLFEQGRWRSLRWRKVLGAVVIAASLASVVLIQRLPDADSSATRPSRLAGAAPYSPRDLAHARDQGRQVLLTVTADWCITCIANEQTVLGTERFRLLLSETETVYMKADWTHSDPQVGALLKAHNAPGVPLYVLYRPDQEGRALPQVLTMETMRQALAPAALAPSSR
jgi:thiol:disulfide interchange protein DsbD